MKSFYLIVCTLCLHFTVYSQTKDTLQIANDSLDIHIPIAATLMEVFQSSRSKFHLKEKDWIAENWDTTVFNPYKNVKKQYPLQISFEDSTYASPIPRPKVITSRYGWRNRKPHNGIDIDLVTGDDVMAMFDGVVRYVDRHSGHGNTVIIRHFNGLETVYAHLSKQSVKVNDTVQKGQIIGKGGATGNARGSHLHLEVTFQGIPIHPEYLFDFSDENTIRNHEIWVTKKWTAAYRHNSKRKSTIRIATTETEAIQDKMDEKKIYTVRRGDTLSRISNKYNVSIAALCKENDIRTTTTLRIGQKLIVTQ